MKVLIYVDERAGRDRQDRRQRSKLQPPDPEKDKQTDVISWDNVL